MTYDASLRLTVITDAIGQPTTLWYQDVSNPLRLTKVTDPFGRFAIFDYYGMNTDNTLLQYRNTFFWDKKAYVDAPTDFTKAKLTHWLHGSKSRIQLCGA